MKKIIFLLICYILSISIVYADMAPMPSLTIKINNLKTNNYIIDLLVYDDGNNYNGELNYNGDGLSNSDKEYLYKINYDGWISESTRWNNYLLFADCAGNKQHMHRFSYFGTPEKYKILIINKDTKEEKLSDIIVRKEFESNIVINYNDMNTSKKSYINAFNIYILIITLLLELFVAYVIKFKNYKHVILINIISNLLLQLFIFFLNNYLSVLIIGEIIVFLIEYLYYKILIKRISTKKIFLYTLISNFITFICTFIVR